LSSTPIGQGPASKVEEQKEALSHECGMNRKLKKPNQQLEKLEGYNQLLTDVKSILEDIFVAEYLPELPSEEELKRKLEEE